MSDADRPAQVEKLVKNYKHYQDRLLQVTKKNRSVLLKKIYKKHNFDLANLEKLKESTVRNVISKAVKNIDATLNDKKDEGERQNILLDSIMSDDADAARSALKTLSRNLGQIEEETGQQTGYLGFPFLQGHANADFYVRGPVVLFPISLEYEKKAKNGGWFLRLEDKRPILNGALIAALKKKGDYTLPENYEEMFDELIEGASAENDNTEEYFFNRINDWIKAVIQIDQSKNRTLAAPLKPLGLDDIETLENQQLHLVSHVIIGNFPQADNEIYKDYDELISNAGELDVGIIGKLVDVEDPDSEPRDLDESHISIDDTSDKELNLVLSSDSSQDEVILESKKSDLVIVRGPPGTGKSQVIVNLISNALTNGEKILVVCQKRAALEVIKQRLGQVDLDRYVVFLEKELDDRGKMYRQLHEIIEEEAVQGLNVGLAVKDISAKIDDCVQYLSELGKALRKVYFRGATAHKLYSKADSQYRPVLDLQSAGLITDWTDLEYYLQKIGGIEPAFKKFEDDGHSWFGRKSFAELGIMEKSNMERLLDDLIELAPRCLLTGSSEGQSRLLSLFDEYVNNSKLLAEKDLRLSEGIEQIIRVKPDAEFVSNNHDSVRSGTEFWTTFGDMLRVFNGEKQDELRMATSDAKSLGEILSSMRESLAEFDTRWMGIENVDFEGLRKDVMDELLQKLAGLAPRCLLADSSEGQSRLLSLFDEYVNNSKLLAEKDLRLSEGIEQIIRVKPDAEFVSNNHDSVRSGTEFWTTFGDMLRVFNGEKQDELRMATSDAKSLGEILSSMRESLAEFDTRWMGIENVDFEGLRKDVMDELLQKLAGLAPRCLLADSSEEQSRLLSLFDEYVANTGLRKLKNMKVSKEIRKIIRVKPDAEFVSNNHDSVRSGTEFWTTFGDMLRVFNGEKQDELRMATSDAKSLGEILSSMRESLAEFDMRWMGIENVDFEGLRKDVMDELLQKLAGLAPRCLLADSSEGQSRLLSLFDEYVNNSKLLAEKDLRLSEGIEQIIRVKPDAEFVSNNHDSVRSGTEFWTTFGDMLRVFNGEKQDELRMATSDAKSLGEILSSMRESLAEFDMRWMGIENVDFEGLRKDVMDELLQKLAGLAPRCLLADSSEGQSRLLSLFDEYQTDLRSLKVKERNLCREITQILRTETSPEFVSNNHDSVRSGTEFWNMFSDLLYYFDDDKQKEMRHMADDAESLSSHLRTMRDELGEFDAIQEFDKKKAEYDGDVSILRILNDAKAHIGADECWTEKIRQEIYAYWLDLIERTNPILKGDPISNYQTKRDNLARLMDEKRQAVMAKIQHDISAAISPTEIYTRTRNHEQKEWKELARELKKRRKLRPVRKLFDQYSYNMLEIAPCWLASPESVSKVFPLERGLFDLIIVDEASQLAVERAIPFLYRAKRVVIAGDEKQLPPFDLFQVREDESEEEDEEISEEKSLLDLARTTYKTINLNWHYRSRYQDLINFSNHAFYDGLLNVAPNAANDPQYPPIRWVKRDGMWENQANHVEANAVIDEMMQIWYGSERKGESFPSIGVITFNDKQQTLITDIIEKKRESDAEFLRIYASANEGRRKDDSLFVKNIENVQGDERDIIIFSIGYGRNAHGQFVNRFGTLNMKGGENRLNVAVTRARREMVVISSIEPSDIKPTSRHDGPRRLKQFLEYAKVTDALNKKGQEDVLTGLNPEMKNAHDSKRAEFDSDFEAQVHEKLSGRGYKVESQVGFSGYRIDLAVVHPDDENRYVLGIECDGATFHSMKSVRERDVMRQKFLEGKGWIIERIWSRNWWRNPNHEIDRLEARIRELAHQKTS